MLGLFYYLALIYGYIMKNKNYRLALLVCAALLFISACGSDNKKGDSSNKAEKNDTTLVNEAEVTSTAIDPNEPVDVEATNALNSQLLASMREISEQQTERHQSSSKDELESLSEADRQALIDLTIEETAKPIEEDAEKVKKLFEEINAQ